MKERFFKVIGGPLNERGYSIATSFEEIETNNKRTPSTIYILGMLPFEEGIVKTFKTKREIFYTHIVELTKRSKDRVNQVDTESYLASSPLQILSFNAEQRLKQEFLEGLYSNSLSSSNIKSSEIKIITNNKEYGYRNKVEFGFYEDYDEYNLYLSFFKREGNSGKYILEDGTSIADPRINELGLRIVKILKEFNISGKELKTLLIRSSSVEVKARLYVTNNEILFENPELKAKFADLPISVVFSDKKSPASITDSFLLNSNDVMTETIDNMKFHFAIDGFFQVNIPVFESMIKDVKEYINTNINSHKPSINLLDLYSGVGVIGMLLSMMFKHVKGVDMSQESKDFSELNTKLNNISNYTYVQSEAEKIVELINPNEVLFLDPPRIGCHLKVIEKIIETKPEHIFYLSCNPITQARDFELLKEIYNIEFIRGYNFYPKTPHLESLIILMRK